MVRIDLAITEIDRGYLQMNTMESLASSIGFASYNPFFTAFKKHTGLSPKKYQILHGKLLNESLANSISEG
jgi:AraC-like DNA-binding protein